MKLAINPKKFAVACSAFVLSLSAFNANAQEVTPYNDQSVRPVNYSDIMFKKTLWFRIDMRQKPNAPFFANGAELSAFLVQAVREGKLTPYKNDSLRTPMSMDEFIENMIVPGTGTLADYKASVEKPKNEGHEDEDWDDDEWDDTGAKTPTLYMPRQMFQLDVKEDLIFDKRHSRMKHDVHALTLIVPASQSPIGIEKPVASFSYKELHKLFKEDPRAVYYNPNNSASNMNLANAFDLRLFSARIIKFGNLKNLSIEELYGETKKALQVSEQMEYSLLEFESNLWSY